MNIHFDFELTVVFRKTFLSKLHARWAYPLLTACSGSLPHMIGQVSPVEGEIFAYPQWIVILQPFLIFMTCIFIVLSTVQTLTLVVLTAWSLRGWSPCVYLISERASVVSRLSFSILIHMCRSLSHSSSLAPVNMMLFSLVPCPYPSTFFSIISCFLSNCAILSSLTVLSSMISVYWF